MATSTSPAKRNREAPAADASEQELRSLVDHVDAIAEIPNSLRNGTQVRLESASVKVHR